MWNENRTFFKLIVMISSHFGKGKGRGSRVKSLKFSFFSTSFLPTFLFPNFLVLVRNSGLFPTLSFKNFSKFPGLKKLILFSRFSLTDNLKRPRRDNLNADICRGCVLNDEPYLYVCTDLWQFDLTWQQNTTIDNRGAVTVAVAAGELWW